MQILVVTPLQAELDAFVQGCVQLGFSREDSRLGRLPVTHLPELGVTLARGGLGKAQFALQTQHLLDMRPGWELVVCAGAAGALADELAVGDVVAATATVEHDHKNRFTTRPLPRFEGDPLALAGFRQLTLPEDFKLYFGPVASGDEDIVDVSRRDGLRQDTEALAVAWEGAGGARACVFSQVPFIELRGITDTADHNAPASFEVNLGRAMGNVARLVTAWSQSRTSIEAASR